MMRRLSIASSIAVGILALAPFSAALASQAPQYISSDPAGGAELHEAPSSVSVSFSEPLDADSELHVFACGKRVDAKDSAVTLNEIEVSLASGPTGKYEVHWTAVGFGGITGTSEGSIGFSVGHGKVTCDGPGHGSGHGGKGGGKHEGSGHGSGGGSGHEGSGHQGSGHQGSGHSSGSGSSHSGSGSSHTGGSSHSGGGSHSASDGDHSGGHGKDDKSESGHGSGHGTSTTEDPAAGNPNFASDGGPFPIPTPESGAVILALVACLGLGITGGWLARLV